MGRVSSSHRLQATIALENTLWGPLPHDGGGKDWQLCREKSAVGIYTGASWTQVCICTMRWNRSR